MQHPGQDRFIKPLQGGSKTALAHRWILQELQRHHRGENDRHQQAAHQGEDQRPGHRLEHLPFDPFQGQHRQKDQHDDPHAVHDGTRHLLAGGQHHIKTFRRAQGPVQLHAALRQTSQVGLGHHDRAVDQQPEIDRAKGKQAGRDPHLRHPQRSE